MNNFYGLIYFIFLIFIIPLTSDYTRAHPTRICSIGNGTERRWWVALLARVRNMDGLVTSAAAAAPFPQWNTWNWWCKSEEAKIKWHKACKKGTRSRSSRLSLTLRSDAPLASSTVRTGCSTASLISVLFECACTRAQFIIFIVVFGAFVLWMAPGFAGLHGLSRMHPTTAANHNMNEKWLSVN